MTGRIGLSRLLRVGDGSTVGVMVAAPPFGGRLALSRSVRVWGGGAAHLCIDDFERTVSDGWGQGPWCLGPWGDGSPLHWVSDGHAHADLHFATEPDAYEHVLYPSPITITNPSRILLRYRPETTWVPAYPTGDTLFRWYVSWLDQSPNDQTTWYTGGITGEFMQEIASDGLPTPGAMNIDDWRAVPSGGTERHDWSEMWTEHADPTGWWNTVVLIDRWGAYSRTWTDAEDEYAHLAPTQPSDYFTDGQGSGESWTIWTASDVARDAVGLDRFGIWPNVIAYAGDDPYTLSFEYVSLSGDLCPCGGGPGTTQAIYNSSFHEWPTSAEVAYWSTDLVWTPDRTPRLFTANSGGGPSGVTINVNYTGPNTLLASATIGAVFFAWTGTASLRKNGTTVATQYLDIAALTDAAIALEYGGEGTTIEVGDVFELVLPACPYSFVSTSFGVRYELYTNGDTP